jgi:TRAP transporter TAXI family solute receptor
VVTKTIMVRTWFFWGMVFLLVVSLLTWVVTRDRIPRKVVIASGMDGGLYHTLGDALAVSLAKKLGRSVECRTTDGSQENYDLLMAGQANIAIMQYGSVDLTEIGVIAPLYREVVYVVVRRDAEIHSIAELHDKKVSVGLHKSGMQVSASAVLKHYHLDNDTKPNEQHVNFPQILDEPDYVAAIVTTGVANPDLADVMSSGDFRLLPLDSLALARQNAHFEPATIPPNLWPPVPEKPVETVSTIALLVVRDDVSPKLVKAVLESLYSGKISAAVPDLISHRNAVAAAPVRLHQTAHRFHDPFDSIGWLTSIMESLAATKELLFALGAGIYLAWDRWRRLKEREVNEEVNRQARRLDSFLDQTLRIERAQMNITDMNKLSDFLDDVTRIKLQALQELTHEDLRSDQRFTIFLAQCANLISKIQLKLIGGDRPKK